MRDEEIRDEVRDEIERQLTGLASRKTPRGQDVYCGSCVRDPHYNDQYWSKVWETESYVLIKNACRDTLLERDEEVTYAELTYAELRDLLLQVRKEVKDALQEQEEAKKDLEQLL